MRIIYVVTRADAVGGANIHVRDIAGSMQELGHRVQVIVGGSGPFIQDLQRHEIPFVSIEQLTRPLRPLDDMRALKALRELFEKEKPELISLHTAKAGWLGRLAARKLEIPVVYTPHGWAFTDGVPATKARLYALAERSVAPLTRRIIGVCEAERSLALRFGVGNKGQHVVIHNGMPVLSKQEGVADPSIQPAKLIMIARFDEPKDHDTLLLALSRLKSHDWKLDLVGEGPMKKRAQDLARELGLEERVRFLGALTEVTNVLSQAQLFLLITRWEGFPRSILEAMRARLPVVASDVGGVSEAVIDRQSGRLVRRQDVAGLTRILAELIENPSLRRQFGEHGKGLFDQKFTFEKMFQQTFRLYEEVLAEPAKRGSVPEIRDSSSTPV